MQVTPVGSDLAKRVFQVHGVDKHGKVVLHKRLSRDQLLPFLANLAPCLVGLECGIFYKRLGVFAKLATT